MNSICTLTMGSFLMALYRCAWLCMVLTSAGEEVTSQEWLSWPTQPLLHKPLVSGVWHPPSLPEKPLLMILHLKLIYNILSAYFVIPIQPPGREKSTVWVQPPESHTRNGSEAYVIKRSSFSDSLQMLMVRSTTVQSIGVQLIDIQRLGSVKLSQ